MLSRTFYVFLWSAVGLVGIILGQEGTPLPQNPTIGSVWHNSIGMKMIYCPAGEFLMGSPPEEKMRQEEERQHPVRVSKSFYLGATEVTQKQWLSLMEVNRSLAKGENLPVHNVSWQEATDFCRRLSLRDGKQYRLPSEAEWEYACRAGKMEIWDSGEGITELAWYADNSGEICHPVAAKKANAWGLSDMLGNLAEWCSDFYAPYSAGMVSDPTGPASGTARVVRGGSWHHFRPMLRPAARSSAPESYQYAHLGFRVLMEVKGK